ncbi:MAG: BlaI/MecI/CopY family transcriptional regulator, partial [Planctomycetes bacterium]|nr:BlaI/MecI/CopY family transcriptional regulator [Planctomycetota bacterium]
MAIPEPTDRELLLLKVLWDRGEATVREVYEALRGEVPIVQNTVQAFLRLMEQ